MSTIIHEQSQFEGMPEAHADGRRGCRSGYLPVRPLRRWLRDYVIKVGGLGNAALTLHVHDRTLWRILREQSWVTIAVADAILTAAGEPHTFAILYPLDDTAGVL